MNRLPITTFTGSAIAHLKRDRLTADEQKLLEGTEVLQITPRFAAGTNLTADEIAARGIIYSVGQLLIIIDERGDELSAEALDRLNQLYNVVQDYHYFWLV